MKKKERKRIEEQAKLKALLIELSRDRKRRIYSYVKWSYLVILTTDLLSGRYIVILVNIPLMDLLIL